MILLRILRKFLEFFHKSSLFSPDIYDNCADFGADWASSLVTQYIDKQFVFKEQ